MAYVKYYIKKLNLHNLLNDHVSTFEQLFTKHCLVILNKTDLNNTETFNIRDNGVFLISCKTENGITNLIQTITDRLKILCGEPSQEHPSMNQQRHRQHLTDCLNCLNNFLNEYSSYNNQSDLSPDLVLMAEHLRKALRHLGKLVGTVTTENLLDIIFKDFCIG
ncbi:hypothetical protein NQ315_005997, partial [Exocentrus adspersus]